MLKIVDVSSWQNTGSYNLGEFDGLIAKATITLQIYERFFAGGILWYF